MPRIYEAPSAMWSAAIYGPAKTGKSYLAVTFPKPMVIVETDPLSFDRAFKAYLEFFPHFEAVEMDIGEPVQRYDADIFIYRYPLTTADNSRGIAQVRYEQMAQTIIQWMSIPDYIKTIVLDTGDVFWENLYTMRLEQADMTAIADGKRPRRNLIPVEYTPCNAAMTTFYRLAKQNQIHLVTTHGYYPAQDVDFDTKQPINRTEQEQCRGWKRTPEKADVMIMQSSRGPMIPGESGVTFEGKITSSGENPKATYGQTIQWPTYEVICDLIGKTPVKLTTKLASLSSFPEIPDVIATPNLITAAPPPTL